MTGLRRHIARRRLLFAWLVAAAFAMKLLVPTGFMPVLSADGIRLALCNGANPPAIAAMPAMPGHPDGEHHPGNDATTPCPFAMLSIPSLAGADPIQLVLAIAFGMVLLFRAAPLRPYRRPTHLRPPLRGPPLPA